MELILPSDERHSTIGINKNCFYKTMSLNKRRYAASETKSAYDMKLYPLFLLQQ